MAGMQDQKRHMLAPKMHSDLCGVSAIGKVGDHVDAHALLGELHKGLVLVGPDIQLGLDNGAEWRAQLPQLFLGGFIGQIPYVEHLWESEKGVFATEQGSAAGWAEVMIRRHPCMLASTAIFKRCIEV